jgi:pSer/pThr/pTyr-binding forkhead associated (FHA) protein
VIIVEEGFLAVRDFGSKNGTFVNGEQIRAERELHSGDRIRFGPLEFDVELAVGVGGKKKPKVHNVQEAAARTVQSAGDEDMDIFSLLGEDDDSSAVTHTGETRTMDTIPTTASATGETVLTSEQKPAEKKEKTRKEKPHGPGRLQPKKHMSRDSQAAADDMLRQLFGRRH